MGCPQLKAPLLLSFGVKFLPLHRKRVMQAPRHSIPGVSNSSAAQSFSSFLHCLTPSLAQRKTVFQSPEIIFLCAELAADHFRHPSIYLSSLTYTNVRSSSAWLCAASRSTMKGSGKISGVLPLCQHRGEQGSKLSVILLFTKLRKQSDMLFEKDRFILSKLKVTQGRVK